ncbi:hypothetical protein PFICI_00948 [Pestalotiopsis fici W106-1]|uniref:NAD(P)-binding protein n=1 Tax=Pestalotiopsis fici (strain W106-1 / CGMCC3.15140) TaxID=1229662 RepID=W3XMC9_PESFW|nr:uncharacterized protein PFICI_00948 [Pestalotiopsis fici W106-1]ETS87120.1 hypothetical protein PFICI_00948 [Pestalotiopsis fici W106-1]
MTQPATAWMKAQVQKGNDRTRLTLPDADLSNKWVVISGANNGIGRHAAIKFAAWGANMVLACRDAPAKEVHPTEVVAECREAALQQGHANSVIEWWQVDYTELKSVEEFAQKWLQTGRALDLLLNNAGIGSSPGGSSVFKTKDGFEIIHQVNFLSHVLLTLRLLPSLAKSRAPRIVCTTSSYHYLGDFNLQNCNGELGSPGHEGVNYYKNNKLWFQVWLTELQSRMLHRPEYQHITINGVHPGFVNSGIWNLNNTESWLTTAKRIWVKLNAYFYGISEEQGSLALLKAATCIEAGPDPQVQSVGEDGGKGGGRYFSRFSDEIPMPQAHDSDSRQSLWIKVNDELKLREKGLLDILGFDPIS